MATANSTAAQNDATMSSIIDQAQNLANRIAQLDAMVAVTYGEQGEAFRNMNDDIQDKFMWGINTITDQLSNEAEKLINDIFAFRSIGESAQS